jgi:hypothetical protein
MNLLHPRRSQLQLCDVRGLQLVALHAELLHANQLQTMDVGDRCSNCSAEAEQSTHTCSRHTASSRSYAASRSAIDASRLHLTPTHPHPSSQAQINSSACTQHDATSAASCTARPQASRRQRLDETVAHGTSHTLTRHLDAPHEEHNNDDTHHCNAKVVHERLSLFRCAHVVLQSRPQHIVQLRSKRVDLNTVQLLHPHTKPCAAMLTCEVQ